MNTLKDDRNIAKSVLPGISPSNSRAKEGTAEIVAARLVDRGPLATAHGPVALLLLGRIKEDQRGAGSSSPSASSLEVLSLRTGVVVKRLDLGQRSFDALDVSARYIVLVSRTCVAFLERLRAIGLGHADLFRARQILLPVLSCSTRIICNISATSKSKPVAPAPRQSLRSRAVF